MEGEDLYSVKWYFNSREFYRYSPSGVNFINILLAHFWYEILAPKITNLCFGFEIFAPKILYEKAARKTLMKLTSDNPKVTIFNHHPGVRVNVRYLIAFASL